MSLIGPTEFKLKDGKTIILNRIILDLVKGERKAAIMLGPKGESIIATENFGEKELSLL